MLNNRSNHLLNQKFLALVLINGSEQMLIIKSAEIRVLIEDLAADIKNVIDTADDKEQLMYQSKYEMLVEMRKSITKISSNLDYMSRSAEQHMRTSNEVFESLLDTFDETSKQIIKSYSLRADRLLSHDGQLWTNFDEVEISLKSLLEMSQVVFESETKAIPDVSSQGSDSQSPAVVLTEDEIKRAANRKAKIISIHENLNNSLKSGLDIVNMALTLGAHGALDLSQTVATIRIDSEQEIFDQEEIAEGDDLK